MPDVPGRPIWQIIQAITGIYCAVLATIAYLYPRFQSHGAQPIGGGPAMNLSALILLGLGCLGIAVAVPALQKVWKWWRGSPAPQRLTVRIINGFVARKQNEWSTMLLLLEVKVDGPPAEVAEWRLHLKYERAARAAFHVPIDPTKMRLEYCPAGDRNVYRADPIPKAVPDRGWVLFGISQASDELFDHVFGATFVLNAVEHNEKTSTLKQPPEFWLHRADIIQWSELRD